MSDTDFPIHVYTPKFIETCERILALEPFNISMSTYTSALDPSTVKAGEVPNHKNVLKAYKHPCGTTYCLAGKLAAEDGYPEQFRLDRPFEFFHHGKYLKEYLEVPFGVQLFIFGGGWPDDLELAKKRVRLVLENTGKIDFMDLHSRNLIDYGMWPMGNQSEWTG